MRNSKINSNSLVVNGGDPEDRSEDEDDENKKKRMPEQNYGGDSSVPNPNLESPIPNNRRPRADQQFS